jgi:hypothetical protein
MKWPPYLIQLKVYRPDYVFNIWLPLFIIGPIALIFLFILFIIAPFLLLSLLFSWRYGWLEYVIKGIPVLFFILYSAPGLKVDVEDGERHVMVAFY